MTKRQLALILTAGELVVHATLFYLILTSNTVVVKE
jgi:hypothetical protein